MYMKIFCCQNFLIYGMSVYITYIVDILYIYQTTADYRETTANYTASAGAPGS